MSHLLSTKVIDNETNYKIWSTIIDSYLSDEWLSKNELIQQQFWFRFRDFAQKFIEDAVTFPNNYRDKETGKRMFDNDIHKKYYEFMNETLDNENGNELFWEKFSEELKTYNINLKVDDGKYNIETK